MSAGGPWVWGSIRLDTFIQFLNHSVGIHFFQPFSFILEEFKDLKPEIRIIISSDILTQKKSLFI